MTTPHEPDHPHAHAPGHEAPDGGPLSFDERAATWDDEEKTARARSVVESIAAATGPSPTTRLLEYGAGTGLVAQFLADRVGPVTLADSSAGMRAVAADKVAAGVLPAGTRVWDLDLARDRAEVPVPADRFDLIVTVLTLHHVQEVATVLSGLGALLADGGALAIVDFETEDGSFHGEGADVAHGFSADDLGAVAAAAGLRVDYRPGVYAIDKDGRDYPLFLAVCTRA